MSAQRKKIAIIEDEQDVLRLLAELLTKEGYEVHGLRNATEVGAWITANKPDLVLLDLVLPLLSGKRVVEALQGWGGLGNARVIIVSGRSEEELRDAAGKIGAVAYLRKPFDNQRLLDLVKRHV